MYKETTTMVETDCKSNIVKNIATTHYIPVQFNDIIRRMTANILRALERNNAVAILSTHISATENTTVCETIYHTIDGNRVHLHQTASIVEDTNTSTNLLSENKQSA